MYLQQHKILLFEKQVNLIYMRPKIFFSRDKNMTLFGMNKEV